MTSKGAVDVPQVVVGVVGVVPAEDTIVRIRPARIIAFGIDPGDTTNARSVSAP